MIHLVYYSLGGNTAKFADKLVEHPRLAPHVIANRFFADGIHKPYKGFVSYRVPPAPRDYPSHQSKTEWGPWLREKDTVLVLVPTFGRFDRDLGRTVDFVPECLKKYAEVADAAVVFGNRNFGADYCAAKKELQEEHGVKTIREVELAGTDEDVDAVVDWLCAVD